MWTKFHPAYCGTKSHCLPDSSVVWTKLHRPDAECDRRWPELAQLRPKLWQTVAEGSLKLARFEPTLPDFGEHRPSWVRGYPSLAKVSGTFIKLAGIRPICRGVRQFGPILAPFGRRTKKVKNMAKHRLTPSRLVKSVPNLARVGPTIGEHRPRAREPQVRGTRAAHERHVSSTSALDRCWPESAQMRPSLANNGRSVCGLPKLARVGPSLPDFGEIRPSWAKWLPKFGQVWTTCCASWRNFDQSGPK